MADPKSQEDQILEKKKNSCEPHTWLKYIDLLDHVKAGLDTQGDFKEKLVRAQKTITEADEGDHFKAC